MDAPRTFLISKICLWGLTGSCAALGLFGVVGMFTPDGDFLGLDRTGWCVLAMALVMAFAIASVNNMADAAMHAIEKARSWREVHWPTLVPALICAAGFAVGSNVGVHLGWEILKAGAAHPGQLPPTATVDAVFLFLSLAKPLSMFAVSGREALDRRAVERAQADREAREEAARTERLRMQHEETMARIGAANRPTEPIAPVQIEPVAEPVSAADGKPQKKVQTKFKVVDTARKTAVAVAALGLVTTPGMAAAEAAQAPQTANEPAAKRAPGRPAQSGDEAARTEGKRLAALGYWPHEIRSLTGLPNSTCKRYSLELRPKDGLRKDATPLAA